MLAEPSNIYSGYQGGILQPSPLVYQQHSISRSDNLNVQPLHRPQQYNYQQEQPQQQQQQQQQAQYRSDDQPAPAAQNFLSTFFREHHQYIAPISHTRNYFSAGEPFSTTPRAPRLTGPRNVESIPKASSFDTSILGSGDFGVLRGGTFYQDNDPTLFRSSESSNDFSYYNNNKNGHGRPQTAAYIQRYTYPEDQFANFRDFADINTPNEPAYSHYVVVYRNRNGTAVNEQGEQQQQQERKRYEPKNILDQLRLLDEEKSATATERSAKSKSKAKLKRTKLARGSYKKHPLPKQDEYSDDLMFEDVLESTHRKEHREAVDDPLLALS